MSMKAPTAISQISILLLGGCSLLTPKTTFAIASADQPVRSASLKLCGAIYPFAQVDGRWEVSVRVTQEDCDNGVSVVMRDGKNILCTVGYVTGGFPKEMQFHIRGTSCRSDAVYRSRG